MNSSQNSRLKAAQQLGKLVKQQKLSSFLVLIIIFILACSEKPPIPEDKFIKVYTDLLVIVDTTSANNFSIDSVKTVVFDRYNITSKQYTETINYYNSEPEKWEVFFDSATSYVEVLKKNAENQP